MGDQEKEKGGKKNVKKRIFLVLLVAVLTLGIGGYVFAAGPTPTPTTSIYVIGDETGITIENPFEVKAGAMSINLPGDGKLCVGEKIATIPLTVRNNGRMPYRINIAVRPAKPPTGDVWPNFDLLTSSKGTVYYPWNMPVIAAGAVMELTVEISIAYRSPLGSFQGLIVDVWPGPTAETSAGKG